MVFIKMQPADICLQYTGENKKNNEERTPFMFCVAFFIMFFKNIIIRILYSRQKLNNTKTGLLCYECIIIVVKENINNKVEQFTVYPLRMKAEDEAV